MIDKLPVRRGKAATCKFVLLSGALCSSLPSPPTQKIASETNFRQSKDHLPPGELFICTVVTLEGNKFLQSCESGDWNRSEADGGPGDCNTKTRKNLITPRIRQWKTLRTVLIRIVIIQKMSWKGGVLKFRNFLPRFFNGRPNWTVGSPDQRLDHCFFNLQINALI